MKKAQEDPRCPFLGEIVMDYCEAYPVKKPIPKHQIHTPTPCTGDGHKACPVFIEIMARMQQCAAASKPDVRGAMNLRRR